MVAGRDFCCVSTRRCLEDITPVLASRSTEHARCPAEPNLVRAEIALQGLVVRPDGAASCTVDYLSRADLKGKVPGGLEDTLAEEDPLILGAVRKRAEAEHAEIALKVRLGDTPVCAA